MEMVLEITVAITITILVAVLLTVGIEFVLTEININMGPYRCVKEL